MNIFSWFKKKEKYSVYESVRVKQMIRWGEKRGWVNPIVQTEQKMLSMFKHEMRINIYYTTLTVATCLNHPVHGKTQLFRKNVDENELVKILDNPRSHLGKGYRELQYLNNTKTHGKRKSKSKKK